MLNLGESNLYLKFLAQSVNRLAVNSINFVICIYIFVIELCSISNPYLFLSPSTNQIPTKRNCLYLQNYIKESSLKKKKKKK